MLSLGAGLWQALAERDSALPTDLETIAVQLFCSDCHQVHKARPLTADKFLVDEAPCNATSVECLLPRNAARVARHLVARAGPQGAREPSRQWQPSVYCVVATSTLI
jgi:hypothetical protein